MQLVTDSAADLTPQDIHDWGIHVAPMMIQFPDEEVSAADISADDFYDRLRAMSPQVPTTSQPPLNAFTAIYNQIADTGEEAFSVHISSGLSGTYNVATLAAQQVPQAHVTTVDTRTLSCGQRFQVLVAAMAIKAGWDTPQILQRLDNVRAATEAAYTLETLEYLERGGRIGRVQALAGSLLRIKPVITVDRKDGKYSTQSRGRTINQTITSMVDHFVAVYGATTPVWATVLHGQFAEKAEIMAAEIRSRLNVARFDTIRISPVLGAHTGPGIVGGGVIPMELLDGLTAPSSAS